VGVPFEFNPDPKSVKNFRLQVGDQGLAVFFSGREELNTSHYYLYFSLDPDDLEILPTSESELRSAGFASLRKTLNLVNGKSLQSPLKIDASDFGGRVSLGPLPNGQEVYFRVQVVNRSGKFSSDNPESLGEAPSPTEKLSEIFGSENSCSLRAQPNASKTRATGRQALLILLSTLFILLGIRWDSKKIGPSV
jgi:hypothetical protein